MPTRQHRYMCECPDHSCTLELPMTHAEYLRLAAKGAVRHPDCAYSKTKPWGWIRRAASSGRT